MFEKILLPLDFSPQSLMMLDCILELKHFGTNEIVLINVGASAERKNGGLEEQANGLVKKLEAEGIRTKMFWREGDAVAQIISLAEEEHVSMIAMASSGKGMARELLVGSTSFGVIRSSNIPVLIDKFQAVGPPGESVTVRPTCTSIFHKALVPIDFSPCSSNVIDLIPRLSRLGLRESVLFHVVDSAKYNVSDGARFNKVAKDLNSICLDLMAQDCNVTTHVHFGSIPYNIVEATRELEATLIVLAAHGKSLLHEVALGGNSVEVIRRSTVPLLIIPCED